MSRFRAWMRRRRVLAAFVGGVLVTVAAVAIVAMFVLADQRRSARVLAAALTKALEREVQIDRVTDLGPSRVVLHGLRLPAEAGWPADVKAESVEASGPLLEAARGGAAPVKVLVTRPTVAAGGGGPAGAAALEGLRQGLVDFLGSAALLDVAVSDGVLEVSGEAAEKVTFQVVIHKGSGEARGEIIVRKDGAPSRFTLGLSARTDGDTIRLDLAGDGRLEVLSSWLPPALIEAVRNAPVEARAQLDLAPRDRAAGRLSARFGDLATLESAVSYQDRLLRLSELRGSADLGQAAVIGRVAGPVKGRAELTDGEVTWAPERGGLPQGRVTLHLLDASLPASAAGVDVNAHGIEAKLELAPHDGGTRAHGDLRGDRLEVAGLELAPVATPVRIDLDAAGRPSQVELAGFTTRVLGTPLRGTVAYDAVRARADARVETSAARLDTLARRLGADWLRPSDQLRAGSVRVVVSGLDLGGLTEGRVEADVQGLALRQPEGEAAVDRARAHATVASGKAAVTFEVERVHGTLPSFEGSLARLDGSADVERADGAMRLARATVAARDAGGQEMLQAVLGRPGAGATGPVHVSVRLPALERLAPLWPAVQRQVTGSATVELDAPDLAFGAYEGRLALQVASAELLGGSLSLRDVAADVPLRRGGPAGPAAAGADGPLKIGELVGYGVVLYDLTGRTRAVDQRLTLTDLHYGLYSGAGQGTVELDLGAGGPTVRARITGEQVRVEDFIAAYGIRGGTMTGLLRYDLDMQYRGAAYAANGRLGVPDGGTVTIELLDRLLEWANADPTGVVKRALGNLRAFDYKAADILVSTDKTIHVTLSLKGRELFGIIPSRVKEINVINMPIEFLARQFPGL